MKLIYIYGPPASGKLTVARRLEKITGYKLFHNHLINDMISEIIPFEHPKFWKFSNELKLMVLDKSSALGVRGIIFTNVYVGGDFPEKVKKIARKNGDKIYFVKLEPSKKALLRRVKHPSRKKYKKISSKAEVKKFVSKHEIYNEIASKNQLIVNNSKIPAKEVAENIVKKFRLRRLGLK